MNIEQVALHYIARAIEWGHKFGFYRMVIDENIDKILEVKLVGYETAESVDVLLSLMEAVSFVLDKFVTMRTFDR